MNRPDVAAEMAFLKDFQRDSVEHVFRRMYLDEDVTTRFLVADEVGLGKTMIARGVIAKAIDHLWDRTPRIDVVYICSNADIARQNINRMNVIGDAVALPTRITNLPVRIHDLEGNKVNFVSLTPGTSFELKSSMGRSDERALLFWLLKDIWGLRGRGAQDLLQGSVQRKEVWGRRLKQFDRDAINQAIAARFQDSLELHIAKERERGEQDIRARFDELSAAYRRRSSREARDRVGHLVGELRGLLAATCIESLEPDLIILDEFQRFKHLLHGDSEAAGLAKTLFEYTEAGHQARVLLLSATPYKMYTLGEEDADDHYRDFVDTLRFLFNDPDRARELEGLIGSYRQGLYRLASDVDGLFGLRDDIQRALRQVMVRTERLAVTDNRNGMLEPKQATSLRLEPDEARAYVTLSEIARTLDHHDIIEYWKSAPYLFNFMDKYALKTTFEKQVGLAAGRQLATILRRDRSVLLPWSDVTRYEAIDPHNARLRSLMHDTVGSGAWKLLWIPPSMPYYQPDGAFAEPALQGFTKRLVFSSWVLVPKVIASLVSYEAERQAMRSYDPEANNTSRDRERHNRPLLNFTRSEGRLTGLPIMTLLYPSVTLAEACDPVELRGDGEIPTLSELLAAARDEVGRLLTPVVEGKRREGREDERWYWAAPILLDMAYHPKTTAAWFDYDDLDAVWRGEEEEAEQRGWHDHLEEVRGMIHGTAEPLGRPPADLAEVLALIGVASPAVCGLRAYARVLSGSQAFGRRWARDAAAFTAWGFRSLFNRPEATFGVRGVVDGADDSPYWLKVLTYCAQGGLQAVLDEYVHVLRDSLGLVTAKTTKEAADAIAEAIREAIVLRTAAPRVDRISVDGQGQVLLKDARMRAHFAHRFGQEKVEGEEGGTRADQLRKAFNSPFWPFVLATTSVGQEGLDFHNYCHAVVHWNLPANPVDLEQREGRVHRYKGHAVRKNVAAAYGRIALDGSDPWTAMFDAAHAARSPGEPELTPYWVFAGEHKIERYVPAMPLSRDEARLTSLRRSLAAYRLVFGQPRQDDLVEFLLKRFEVAALSEQLDALRIDLSPPRGSDVVQASVRTPADDGSDDSAPRRGRSSARVPVWTFARFVSEMQEQHGEEAAVTARALYRWAQGRGLKIWWGYGKKTGSFYPMVPGLKGDRYTFALQTDAYVIIPVHGLGKHPPYTDDRELWALLDRIEEATGRRLPHDRRKHYPVIPLAAVGGNIEAFLAVWDDHLNRLRRLDGS